LPHSSLSATMYLSCLSCCLSNIYIIFYSFFHILDLWSFFLVSKKNQNRTLWVQFSRLLSRFSLSQNGPNGRLRAQEILTEISICSQRIDSKKTVLRLDLKVSCIGWRFRPKSILPFEWDAEFNNGIADDLCFRPLQFLRVILVVCDRFGFY